MSSILDFLNTPSNNNNLKAFKEDYSDFSSIDKANDPIGVIKSEEEKEVEKRSLLPFLSIIFVLRNLLRTSHLISQLRAKARYL